MGGLVSLAGPCPVNYQGLCCVDAVSYWLTGLGQEEGEEASAVIVVSGNY